MKNLETLIQELCPDGVEFVKLGDVCELRAGWGFPTKEQGVKEGKYPFYKVADMNNSTMFMSSANNYISEETSRKLRCKPAPKGTIIFPKIGATMATNKKRILTQEACYDNNVMGLIAHSINAKFLYYLLSQVELLSFTNGFGAVPSLDRKKIENFEIPLPPIEVQNEIVRILDKFTSLEAELEAELKTELDSRKRQYEYYRDKLLSFDNVEGQEVEWKKMSEVSFYPKTRIDASELSDNSYIGVENLLKDKLGRTDSTVKPESSVIQFVEKDILIGNIRPYLRKIWKSDCKGGTNGDVLCIRVKVPSEVSADYLFHILSSEKFFLYDIKNSKGAKMPRGDKSAVMDFKIPIPSLEEQHRIVSILDRFESLTTSLQSGLPAEITARRQQYEHYRDKLLTFKRKGAA